MSWYLCTLQVLSSSKWHLLFFSLFLSYKIPFYIQDFNIQIINIQIYYYTEKRQQAVRPGQNSARSLCTL